jgi:DNA-binding transcriptional MerR regulator
VVSSWPNFVSECKSRLSAIARSCFLGRARWREKFQEVKELLEALQEESAQSEARRTQLEQENLELRERVSELEIKLAQPQPVTLPLGKVPGGQQFGAGMITLCVNLARKIGLRSTNRSLRIVFDWLGVETTIPSYQTIRGWMQRIGLDRMQHAKKIPGGVWLADHTNQIGKEKVLVVLRVRDSKLPRRGVALRHQDVEVLAVVPGEAWKRDDVAKVYQQTAERYGLPRGIESDGAVELREPAENLGKPGKKPLVIRDPKHFLANRFEALLTHDPQYQAFAQRLGGTRSALQQTELAHFIPPNFKMKARFMNLARTLNWASTILWHLDHPESRSRKGITESRMREKLGWLRDFAPSIQQWQECQEVVSEALTFINRHGIFRGAAKQFQNLIAGRMQHPVSQRLVRTVVEFLRAYEPKLRPHERLPMSTEILESSFSLYKQLEKQHSKSGFTSLLLAYPMTLRATTPKEVTASFARIKVADVKKWITQHLPSTVASKRQLLFREARTKTQDNATPVSAAA